MCEGSEADGKTSAAADKLKKLQLSDLVKDMVRVVTHCSYARFDFECVR